MSNFFAPAVVLTSWLRLRTSVGLLVGLLLLAQLASIWLGVDADNLSASTTDTLWRGVLLVVVLLTIYLLAALAQMCANLVQIVNQVRAGADHIANGSHQIAAGYTDLSQRTEEQASTLEETAASMEELSATVKQNEHNCREADASAEEAGA